MDNLTHSLVGLVGAKAGLERWSAGATAASILAANLPDIDVFSAAWGPWVSLEQHRGITHSILGVAVMPFLLAGAIFVSYRAVGQYRGKETGVKFVPLLVICLVMAATHPLLDWTNNYGIRPYLPWSGKWYYGDLLFVIDPWIWALLGGIGFLFTARSIKAFAAWGALAVLITILSFVGPLGRGGLEHPTAFRAAWIMTILAIIAVRTLLGTRRPRQIIAQVGLMVLVLYCGALAVAHKKALTTAQHLARLAAEPRRENLVRVAAMPTFASPLSWQSIAETDQSVFSFKVDLLSAIPANGPVINSRYPKPAGDNAAIVDQAGTDPRAGVLARFARFPVATVEGNCLTGAIVHFADLRYTRPGVKNAAGNFSLDVNVECSGPGNVISER